MNSIRETSLVAWCTLHFSLGGKAEFSCHPGLEARARVGPELCVGLNSSTFKVQDLEGDVFVLALMLFSLVPEGFVVSPFSLKFKLAFVRLFYVPGFIPGCHWWAQVPGQPT